MKNFDWKRLDAYTIIRDIINNIWVILLAFIIGTVGFSSYSDYIKKPTYSSSATISVGLENQGESSAILSRTEVISDSIYSVFSSDAMKNVVENAIKIPAGNLTAKSIEDTNFFTVTATANDPYTAYLTVKAVCDNYYKVTDYIYSNITLNVISSPAMQSSHNVSTLLSFRTLLVGVASALVIILLIAFISFMRDTVKSEYDIETEVNTSLFASIDMQKASVNRKGEPVPITIKPHQLGTFAESYKKMAIKLESLQRSKGFRVIEVSSIAENEGKSTVAINLATALSARGNSVLLIDCDLKKSTIASTLPDVERPEGSDFGRYLRKGGDLAFTVKRNPETGVSLADSVEAYAGSADMLSAERFRNAITTFREQFDFVIVDTPPRVVAIDSLIISDIADTMLLVVRQDTSSIPAINDFIEEIGVKKISGCVFNDVGKLNWMFKRNHGGDKA